MPKQQPVNEINKVAQRKRVAAQELAEADKIKIVTAASLRKLRKTACMVLVLLSSVRPLWMVWLTHQRIEGCQY